MDDVLKAESGREVPVTPYRKIVTPANANSEGGLCLSIGPLYDNITIISSRAFTQQIITFCSSCNISGKLRSIIPSHDPSTPVKTLDLDLDLDLDLSVLDTDKTELAVMETAKIFEIQEKTPVGEGGRDGRVMVRILCKLFEAHSDPLVTKPLHPLEGEIHDFFNLKLPIQTWYAGPS